MTNEKAIEAIKFGHCDDIYYRKEYEEAVNMAIKALKQELILDKMLDKAKQEIRCGENKAYNADFTMGCEYAISVIERMFEEVEE